MTNVGLSLEQTIHSDIIIEPIIQGIKKEVEDSTTFFDTNIFLPYFDIEKQDIFEYLKYISISNPKKLKSFYEGSQRLLEFLKKIIENNEVYVTDAILQEISSKKLEFDLICDDFSTRDHEAFSLFKSISSLYSENLNSIIEELKNEDKVTKEFYLGRMKLHHAKLYKGVKKITNNLIDFYEKNRDKCGKTDRELITELLYTGILSARTRKIIAFSNDEHITTRLKYVYTKLFENTYKNTLFSKIKNRIKLINIRVIGMNNSLGKLGEYASTEQIRLMFK